jgi:soluble lytic murein transglycosylase-like protein
MMSGPSLLSGTLRYGAVGLGTLAVAVVLQQEPAERPHETIAKETVSLLAAEAPVVRARSWSLHAGGWYIRVDGAEVPIPSLAEMTAAPPRASLAITISPFDRLIAHQAKAEGFDWRLIAALIFEESRFDPASRSEQGAEGLMQVRPIAAEAVGAVRFHAPADNVQTGVRYLRQLDEAFHSADDRDRLAIILAAYNAGPGHVRDAQTLARRFGYDPNRWENALQLVLPLLEEPSLYKQLPNGFAKGSDTVAYVTRILARYRRYQLQTATPPDADARSSSEASSANG